MNSMISKLKENIPMNIKYKLLKIKKRGAETNKFEKYKQCKKILFTVLPTHGNLGDHAIAYAGRKYIEDNYEGYEIIELTMLEMFENLNSIKKIMNEDDLIFTIGGGNMNNHYKLEEMTRRLVIDEFKNIKIISLPQTISYTNDSNGKLELKGAQKIYGKHNNLTLIAREDKSFNIMKERFKNNKIIKNPDIVLYLEDLYLKNNNSKREGIMICLRDDLEGFINLEQKNQIIDAMKKCYKTVDITDTVIDREVTLETREKELYEIWNRFSNSKVVITDRLHGMIFSVITKTPCIVVRTFDHKVVESYKWFEKLNYIKLTNDYSIENLINLCEELSKIEAKDETKFKSEYFNTLKKRIG